MGQVLVEVNQDLIAKKELAHKKAARKERRSIRKGRNNLSGSH